MSCGWWEPTITTSFKIQNVHNDHEIAHFKSALDINGDKNGKTHSNILCNM